MSASILILIVDDEPDIPEALSMLLGEAGYSVRTARDGLEALTELADRHIDLIISDAMMPRLNGYDLILALRRRRSSPPVILMSAAPIRIPTEARVWSISKPFDIDALLALVRTVLAAERACTPTNPRLAQDPPEPAPRDSAQADE